MRLHGSNYICVAEDFISSVVVVPLENQKELRTEIHLGKLLFLVKDSNVLLVSSQDLSDAVYM